MREIDCAHSRSVKTPCWPSFREKLSIFSLFFIFYRRSFRPFPSATRNFQQAILRGNVWKIRTGGERPSPFSGAAGTRFARLDDLSRMVTILFIKTHVLKMFNKKYHNIKKLDLSNKSYLKPEACAILTHIIYSQIF